jgi:putative hydrolase of the HAD superfamily
MTGRGLLVDYGGVLTTSMAAAARAFCDETGLPIEALRDVIVQAYASVDGQGPVERLETGLLGPEEFGALLAAEIERRCGVALDADGVVARMFTGLALDEEMLAGVALARVHGVRTAMVSNSWGEDSYPRARLAEVFDVVVISGDVGVRKPDPAIFEHTLEALALPPPACVFVDDLAVNVAAAEALGMAGIVHADAAGTLALASDLLGLAPGALLARPA